MTYNELRRLHAYAQGEHLKAVTVLISAVRFALTDANSTLDEVTRRMLVDGVERVQKISEDAQ